MNKRFSTLMAGALLAGALVTPADLFAQIQFTGGQTYENVAGTSNKKPITSGNYLFTIEEEGINYVLVVNEQHQLVAKPFVEATKADVITIKKSGDNVTLSTGSNMLGVKESTYDDWADVRTNLFTLTLQGDKISIENGSGCFVQRNGLTFKPAFGQGVTAQSFEAKAVKTTAVEDIKDLNEAATSQVIDNRYIVLMSAGTVIADDEAGKGNGELITSVEQEAYWVVKIVNTGADDAEAVATFVNKKTGKTLTFDGANAVAKVTYDASTKKYSFADALGDLKLYKQTDMTTPVEYSYAGGTLSAFTVGVTDDYANWINAHDLMSINGASFGVKIVNSADKSLANDPLTGTLKAVKWNGSYTSEKVVENNDYDVTVMLQNAEGNLVVVDTKDPYASAAGSNSYKVTTITPSALAHALASTNSSVSTRYKYKFTFVASETFVPGEDTNITIIYVWDNNGNYFAEVGSIEKEGTPTLVATPNGTPNNPIKVTIGKFNTIDVAKLLGTTPTFFTVTNKCVKKTAYNYGKVLGLNTDGYARFVKSSEAQLNHPETQWAVTYDADNNMLVFKNRENPGATEYGTYPVSYNVADMYYVGNETNIFAVNGDTIAIEPVKNTTAADGYLRLNADELRDQVYYVGSYSSIYDAPAYFVENHAGSHQIGMDVNKDNATEWNVVPLMRRNYDELSHTTKVYPDTIMVESVLGYFKADGTYTYTSETNKNRNFLKIPAYTLQNSSNKEYIGYNDETRYTLGNSDSKTGYTSPQRYFAIRTVGEGQYNLVEVCQNTSFGGWVSTVVGYNSADKAYYALDNLGLNYSHKMYSGDGASKGILNSTGLYTQTENDIIVIEPRDAAMYRKLAMEDVVKIFRNDGADEAQVLCEKGGFLSIANAVQFPDINPALYVDTAYVDRGSNNRWEYLLAVNAKHWESNVECEIPGHPKHKADTTSGRFLVNLMDSAFVYADNLHNNKFINEEDGEYYAKLGFVNGFHTHDTLFLQRPDGTYAELPLDRKDYSHSIAKFAFRYIDNNEDAFVIETGRKSWWNKDTDDQNEVTTGYLKWLNGTVVVVDDIESAEIFNMTEDDRTPTANEEVAVAGVKVVAGNGQVTIAGAAGKKVVISNILGQVVANTVLTSDNAVVAAPQGVVVVAVEGEAAIKAIVK